MGHHRTIIPDRAQRCGLFLEAFSSNNGAAPVRYLPVCRWSRFRINQRVATGTGCTSVDALLLLFLDDGWQFSGQIKARQRFSPKSSNTAIKATWPAEASSTCSTLESVTVGEECRGCDVVMWFNRVILWHNWPIDATRSNRQTWVGTERKKSLKYRGMWLRLLRKAIYFSAYLVIVANSQELWLKKRDMCPRDMSLIHTAKK